MPTPIEQLKREALAMSFDDSLHGFNRNLAAIDKALAKMKPRRSDVSDVAACAAVEGRAIGAGEVRDVA